ncbi:MAG: CoA transferase [Clostridiaceae bacterium]|nr:CoA transferase [Clostridiaceae bacterium]
MKTLEGIQVLDLTQAYSGPFCTCQLADLGAEVIKIEPAKWGDQTRSWLPKKNGVSVYYTFVNRNKKSVSLNLQSDEGRQIFLELAKNTDVIVENLRPGAVAKLGLDYETVRKVKPDIIYASISGFGQYGPERDRAAYAIIAEAMSGHMDHTGFPDGPPVKTGLSMADTFAGLFAFAGILLALYHREKTGEGQYIDVAMLDCLFSATESAIINHSVFGSNPTRMGNRELFGAPYDCYKAADGYYVLGVGTEKAWKNLCKVLGKPELIDDPRFSSMESRKANEEELTEIINHFGSTKTRAELEELMSAAGIPYAPVLSIAEVMASEHIKARNMIIEMDDPRTIGKYKIAGIPLRMSASEASIDTTAPLLGEHNVEVLSRIGLSEDDVKTLSEKGVL